MFTLQLQGRLRSLVERVVEALLVRSCRTTFASSSNGFISNGLLMFDHQCKSITGRYDQAPTRSWFALGHPDLGVGRVGSNGHR